VIGFHAQSPKPLTGEAVSAVTLGAVRDAVVVGGGIIGLAVARELGRRRPDLRVVVLEKEREVASHQTGRNSGVVHAGVYYAPGSLKATLCRRGVGLLGAYCAERGLPWQECGKLVVAVEEAELPRLAELERRATANGVPGLRLLDAPGLRQVEPAATGIAALHSPSTAITDYRAVSRALRDDVLDAGGQVRLGARVTALEDSRSGVRVRTADGAALEAELVLACAGLHSDTVAALSGAAPEPRIVPFRGDYYLLTAQRRDLVRGLVYPVPDPRYPFLGIHLTKRVDGAVLVGPTAVLAGATEGYTLGTVRPRELAATLAYPGVWALARRHWRTGAGELHRSASRAAFVREAQRLLPGLRQEDVVRGPAGVRAQALTRTGELVDDFVIERRGRVVHVRNAPSPGATSSLAIAEHVVGLVS